MNTLESTITTSPTGQEEECALFTIDTTSNSFVFSNICKIGTEYTLTIWVKSNSQRSIVAAGTVCAVTTEWKKHIVTFTATGSDMLFQFRNTGTYYIYHAKLELGNISTDWSPAPEDMATGEDLADTNSLVNSAGTNIESLQKQVASLSIRADGIDASVTKLQQTTTKSLDDTNEQVSTLSKEVSAKMTSEAVEFQIKQAMEDGASKVVTQTGYTFDADGLLIEKSGSEMKTQITENGMEVFQNNQAVLTANNVGVNAKNLHATTYLIIGDRSRFENFGNNRTGCFWIGDG